jgi:hypothetical protein
LHNAVDVVHQIPHKDGHEGAIIAVEMVAATAARHRHHAGAEHGRIPLTTEWMQWPSWQFPQLVRDGI